MSCDRACVSLERGSRSLIMIQSESYFVFCVPAGTLVMRRTQTRWCDRTGQNKHERNGRFKAAKYTPCADE
uniref:Uncharacterized protein n=1 Tax=Hyaloperonospora arabidopsidis (strain Emoy2) TaxID=559515 RepID=M4BW94_HYAAE